MVFRMGSACTFPSGQSQGKMGLKSNEKRKLLQILSIVAKSAEKYPEPQIKEEPLMEQIEQDFRRLLIQDSTSQEVVFVNQENRFEFKAVKIPLEVFARMKDPMRWLSGDTIDICAELFLLFS